jgi:ABC-type lipopolysaccharide export system ATPase subunit
MQRWKAAGPATREAEEGLWTRFKAAQDTFFTARSAVFDERDAEQQQNLAKKQSLAAEAEKLLPVKDLNAARTALRGIQDRWAEIGHVPRGDKPAIEKRLQLVEQAVRAAEETRWKRSNPEARARAAATVEQLKASIAKLRKQRDAAASAGKQRDVEEADAAIAAREEWLAQAESTLREFSD